MALTWPASRDQILHSCERKYYFQYLAPARINSSNPILREIAFLKKLKTVPLWKGSLFHEVIAQYFTAPFKEITALSLGGKTGYEIYQEKLKVLLKKDLNK